MDNYDSFVYILVQYLGELGAEPLVYRHDAVTVDELRALEPDGILISPGPGTPDDAGVSNELLATLSGHVPIFGVCLGMQCIGQAFGGTVIRAPKVMHGKTSVIEHDSSGVFEGLPNPLTATRYHSLIVEGSSVPPDLEVSATCDGGPGDGSAAPHPSHRGRAVPPRVGADRSRPGPAHQLPGPL